MKTDYVGSDRKCGMTPYTIVLEGVIGVGKSTLLSRLENHYRLLGKKVVVVQEPVEIWKQSGLLSAFYADKKRWTYTFQSAAFADHILACQSALVTMPDAEIVLIERSPVSNRIFAEMLRDSGDMSELEWGVYERWADVWSKLMPVKPNMYLYMRATPEVCLERIKARARPGEELISLEYLKQLHEKHDTIFGMASRTVKVLDAAATDFRTTLPELDLTL